MGFPPEPNIVQGWLTSTAGWTNCVPLNSIPQSRGGQEWTFHVRSLNPELVPESSIAVRLRNGTPELCVSPIVGAAGTAVLQVQVVDCLGAMASTEISLVAKPYQDTDGRLPRAEFIRTSHATRIAISLPLQRSDPSAGAFEFEASSDHPEFLDAAGARYFGPFPNETLLVDFKTGVSLPCSVWARPKDGAGTPALETRFSIQTDHPVSIIPELIAKAHSGDLVMIPEGEHTVQLTIDKDLTLVAEGKGAVINAISQGRAIFIQAGATVRLRGISVVNGRSDRGAGIFNAGTLILENCSVSENFTLIPGANTYGAGIYSDGDLHLTGCVVSGNGTFGIIVAGQTQETELDGGGVYCTGGLFMTNCLVSRNTARSGGAGIHAMGPAVIVDSRIESNRGSQYAAGGIRTEGRTQIIRCSISANRSFFDGGLICSGRTQIKDCRIEDNIADELGGVGAIWNRGDLSIERTAIARNQADFGGSSGGILSDGPLQLTDCDLVANRGQESSTLWFRSLRLGIDRCRVESTTWGNNTLLVDSGTVVINSTLWKGAGTDHGPLVYVGNGSLHLINCTFSGNSPSEGGTLRAQETASIFLDHCTVVSNTFGIQGQSNITLRGSLIAGNGGGDAVGPFHSEGHNLIQKIGDPILSGARADDLTGVDPLLGPLSDNGGRTPTHALLVGSPAIDQGPLDGFPRTDGRGFPRPTDGGGTDGTRSDIGAFEFNGVSPSFFGITSDSEHRLTLGVRGLAGKVYQVDHLTGLTSSAWQILGSGTSGASGLLLFPNLSLEGSSGYFRVTEPSPQQP